jgi:predicted ATPase
MRVEQVTFTGFKSLHDLTLPLGDLTVITGPNGAGKSNFLAGIGFLADVYRVGLEEAMQSAGGFDRVAYRREQTVPEVTFRLQATLGADEVRVDARTGGDVHRCPGPDRCRGGAD